MSMEEKLAEIDLRAALCRLEYLQDRYDTLVGLYGQGGFGAHELKIIEQELAQQRFEVERCETRVWGVR